MCSRIAEGWSAAAGWAAPTHRRRPERRAARARQGSPRSRGWPRHPPPRHGRGSAARYSISQKVHLFQGPSVTSRIGGLASPGRAEQVRSGSGCSSGGAGHGGRKPRFWHASINSSRRRRWQQGLSCQGSLVQGHDQQRRTTGFHPGAAGSTCGCAARRPAQPRGGTPRPPGTPPVARISRSPAWIARRGTADPHASLPTAPATSISISRAPSRALAQGPAEAVLDRLAPLGFRRPPAGQRAVGATPTASAAAQHAEGRTLVWLLAINALMFLVRSPRRLVGGVVGSAFADGLDMFADAAVLARRCGPWAGRRRPVQARAARQLAAGAACGRRFSCRWRGGQCMGPSRSAPR